MRKPRPVLASLVAPLLALIPVLAIGAYQLAQPVPIIDGVADDAPQRAFGLFVVSLPPLYVVLAVMAFALGHVFLRFGFSSLPKFLSASMGTAVLLSLPFSVTRTELGLEDQLISVAVIGTFFALAAAPAATCWLLLARRTSDA